MSTDLSYWDSLPFIGWHRPDFLRIMDGKYRETYNKQEEKADVSYERSLELARLRQVQKIATAERRERERLERKRLAAERKESERAAKEAMQRQNQESYADKRARWAKLQEERKARNEARAVAKMLGLPKPAPKHKPKTYTPEQIEARRERARQWHIDNPKTPKVSEERKEKNRIASKQKRLELAKKLPPPERARIKATVQHLDGTTVTYPSIRAASVALGRDNNTLRFGVANGYLIAGCVVTIHYSSGDVVGGWKKENTDVVTRTTSKPVVIIAPDGTRTNFLSILSAAEYLGTNGRNIRRAIETGYKVRGYGIERA